ncbi:gamma-aminobutyric acid type B receptor subunit 2-like [Betta splendens]|uniref:Gamma-aminobutyric acid type B receptor subunit 2-like n=1 Tax=Betta splendens TaxID=158456 RepID=A0A6P7KZP3_BETSP|nr:gamma-aminobutyric acid type B receptor subunit 2-like [Betta splendens]
MLEALRLLLVLGPVLAQVRHPLPVLWMMPGSSGSGRENLTAAVVPAVRLALQDLQKQPAPLGNYEIQLQLLNSQCDPATALKSLFDAMWVGPKYLLLFGGACPPVASLIARALPALGLVQISFAASSMSLSNRKWYRNLFSTMPLDRALNQAVVKLLQRYKWARVGVVTQVGPRHSEMKKDLMRQLLMANVQVVSTESQDDACRSLEKLKEDDVRIIIAQIEEDSASELFCCAHMLNLFGPQYQWIVAGGAGGWRLGPTASGCAATHVLTAAEGSIRLQILPLSKMNAAGVSGQTPEEYQDMYLRHVTPQGSEVSPLHAFAYDAVWVAAKALTQVMEVVKHREKYRVLRNMSVSDQEVQRLLLAAVRNTRVQGVTGPVVFRNGERMSSIELIQIQGSSHVLVGGFNTSNQQLRLINHLLNFKGRGPARDRALVRLQHRHVSLFVYITVSSAAAVIIFITLLIICLRVINRKHWLLRSSSRSQDGLLLLGVLLSSCSVLISGLDGATVSDWMFEMFCSVHLWSLSVGHTLIFTALFTKTWRIHSLVGAKQKARCVLLWLLLLDAFVLTSWQILDPLRRVVVQHSSESDSVDQDLLVQPFSEHCSSSGLELWLMAVYGYKGPLLGLGCFLAWNTRCAQAPPAGDALFALTGFTVAGVSGSLLTAPSRSLQFCLSSVAILCCSAFILSWMFGPVMFYLCWNNGEQQQQPSPSELHSDEEQDLKSRSAQLDVEIETITMQLSEVGAEDRSSEQNLSLDWVNSSEHVGRRLSVQLPILHHSYLPAVGGVCSSSSSLFVDLDHDSPGPQSHHCHRAEL